MNKFYLFDEDSGTLTNKMQRPEGSITLWSDHLRWQYPNYSEVRDKTIKTDYFDRVSTDKLENFLKLLLDDDSIALLGMNTEINPCNGYPVYTIFISKEDLK